MIQQILVTADKLHQATTTIQINTATAPTINQALIATRQALVHHGKL